MGQILTPAFDATRKLVAVAHYSAMAVQAAAIKSPAAADSFDPIRRSVSFHDALERVDAIQPATDAARITALESELARVCRLFEQVESDLLVELQTALNETCNGYHDEGHASRVERVYGLRMEGV